MNKSYFCSERVRLRAMEPEDLEVMYAMENDSQTWDVTNFTVPYSRFVLKQYIENSECDMFADRQLRMMIVRAEDDAADRYHRYYRVFSHACPGRGGHCHTEGVSGQWLCQGSAAFAVRLCFQFLVSETVDSPYLGG